ncbi:MAG: GNAT family N-acetyltransferase [Bradymonadia bacterium]
MISSARTLLRPLVPEDEMAFIAAAQASVSLHGPWFSTARTVEAFQLLIDRQSDAFRTLVLIDQASGEPAGVFNLSQISMGLFRSAYMGYGAFLPHAGSGKMEEGMHSCLEWAFSRIGLHRLEANIRPENMRSIQLVKRVGFEREGYSKSYLFLDGAWRDHERWAIREEIWVP